MSMYRKLRSIHLATALFSIPFLLAYTMGAVEFAHRQWAAHREYSSVEIRKLAAGVTDARILAREWRGELESIDNSAGFLKFEVRTPLGTSYAVRYAIASGETSVKTTVKGFLTTLAFIHVSHGIWAVAAALVSVALLTLGVSGVCLWFKGRSSRLVGGVLLLFGVVTAVGLIVSIRGG